MNECVDLRPWAKANRYRYRLEQAYQAERPEHRGDGRWYIEVLCRHGLIYPYGGTTLLAYATRGVTRHVAGLGSDVRYHQSDGDAEVFRFPMDRLDEVAAILKPRRRRILDAKHARSIGKATAYGAQKRETAQI
jgi:hypothetical protein